MSSFGWAVRFELSEGTERIARGGTARARGRCVLLTIEAAIPVLIVLTSEPMCCIAS